MNGPRPTSREELEARVGETIAGRFRLTRVLGAGGMGWVYLAEQQPLGRLVAIKLLSADLKTESFRQRFFLEASVAARLSSPYIVTIHDYGETEQGELFIAMELVNGLPLGYLLKRDGPFEPLRLVRLVDQICRGLGVAHDAGVVHRDLKPSNVMVTLDRSGEERIKILDFGLVKAFGEGSSDSELTGAGAVLGSPNSMAPEQIRRGPIDPRTDVYATGALIYRLLTGHHVFEAGTAVEKMTMHLREVPPPIDVHMRDPEFTSRQLEAIAMRCLEKQPTQRYQSMDEVRAALEAVERLMPVGAIAPPRRASSIDLSSPSGLGLADDLSVEIEDGHTMAGSSLSAAPPASLAREPAHRRVFGGWMLGGGMILAAGALVAVVGLPESGPPASPTPQPEAQVPAVIPSEPAEVASPSPRRVLVSTTPSGATVYVGDAKIGLSPLELEVEDPPGALELRLEKSGFQTLERKVSPEELEAPLQFVLSAQPKRRVSKPKPRRTQPVAPTPEPPVVEAKKSPAPEKRPAKKKDASEIELKDNPYD